MGSAGWFYDNSLFYMKQTSMKMKTHLFWRMTWTAFMWNFFQMEKMQNGRIIGI
jgi:hypothetical protein